MADTILHDGPVSERVAQLENQLAAAERRLKDQHELLRRAMVEKGEMLVVELEAARMRDHVSAESREKDPVTGLLRHGYLRARLQFEADRAKAASHPLGLILLDVDAFSAFIE